MKHKATYTSISDEAKCRYRFIPESNIKLYFNSHWAAKRWAASRGLSGIVVRELGTLRVESTKQDEDAST